MQNFAFKFQAVAEKTAKIVRGLLYFATPCISKRLNMSANFFSRPDSPTILVFEPRRCYTFQGNLSAEALNTRGLRKKIVIFSQYLTTS